MLRSHLPARLITGLAMPMVLWVSLLAMPLAQAAAAHRLVEAGRHRGQIVLTPHGDSTAV